jgi:hypothetical protein
VEDGSGIDGGSLFWSEDSSSFFLRVAVDNDFFNEPTGMVAMGRIRYSLSQRRRMEGSISVVNNEEFTFRLEISLAQQPDSPGGGVVSEATETDREESDSKWSINLQIWIPVAVAGAAAICLLLFMFRVITSRRNGGRKRMNSPMAQLESVT